MQLVTKLAENLSIELFKLLVLIYRIHYLGHGFFFLFKIRQDSGQDFMFN